MSSAGDMSWDTIIRACRAISTNQIARAAPKAYFRSVRDTGRGPEAESPKELAEYCLRCAREYSEVLSAVSDSRCRALTEARILEYGPGDFLGTAVALVGQGASEVTCVDRFPLVSDSAHNVAAYELVLDLLPNDQRRRAEECFSAPGRPASGFNEDRIRYEVRGSGLSGRQDRFDLVVSRAVLEHVDDLHATFKDMARALRWGGYAVHLVDLSSHRLHRDNPLDFLTWSDTLWRLMYSHKGAPNRHRLDAYREALAASELEVLRLEPSKVAPIEWVHEVRPRLGQRFSKVSDEDLMCLGFWLVCRKTDE
jgi:SAM-dependent methyltransferase